MAHYFPKTKISDKLVDLVEHLATKESKLKIVPSGDSGAQNRAKRRVTLELNSPCQFKR